MIENLEYLQMLMRFPAALRRFLWHSLSLEEAQCSVRERMEQRDENFLRMVERGVYGYPRSPYLPLLKMAGCELGDLRALVKQKGLEGTLRDLREAGVYFSFEEFKGRVPTVRHGQTLTVEPKDFDNPFAHRHLAATSGGSTGTAGSVGFDLELTAMRASHAWLNASVHGVLDAPMILWRGIIPDSTLDQLLQYAYMQRPIERWFSNIGLRTSKHWIKYGLATYYVLFWMRLYGVAVPLPDYVSPDRAVEIAQAVADLLKTHRQCRMTTTTSGAMRICLEAQRAGISLEGLVIEVGGEPITSAKVRAIESAGARHIGFYAMTETGILGKGCANPLDHDDIHLFKDAFAVIDYAHHVDAFNVTVPAFNLTTLVPVAPKLLLNLQTDDYGIIEERACGCGFEAYGYTTHLREIRSYSKLTGEGVTLIGGEIIRVLEEVLPVRFGGSPHDYQLMEQEDERGLTRLYLLVHPRLDIANEQAVIDIVLDALRRSSAMADSARSVWQQTGTLQIKRMEPVWTARGKLMPLHLRRKDGNA